MGEFNSELEILQDENFAIKAPKGFKGADWNHKNGRTGRVLYSRFSPDYIASDCYITVSTIARDPITDEVRNQVERYIGKEGFDFTFSTVRERPAVLYFHEEERDYRTYHGLIMLGYCKAVMVDVIFNTAFDNSKEVALNIINSIKTNFKAEVTPEELERDRVASEVESKAEAQREAAKQANKIAGQDLDADKVLPEDEETVIAQMVEEEPEVDERMAQLDEAMAEVMEEEPINADELAKMSVEEEEEEIADALEISEAEEDVYQEPVFEDSEDGRLMQIIYNYMKQHNRMTLSELQSVPELIEVGRMGITKLMNVMIRDGVLVRFEDSDNIYFCIPGYENKSEIETDKGETSELSPMEQYKIDYEQYKIALAQWKKSKNFFGHTDVPKPVEPVKPKKK